MHASFGFHLTRGLRLPQRRGSTRLVGRPTLLRDQACRAPRRKCARVAHSSASPRQTENTAAPRPQFFSLGRPCSTDTAQIGWAVLLLRYFGQPGIQAPRDRMPGAYERETSVGSRRPGKLITYPTWQEDRSRIPCALGSNGRVSSSPSADASSDTSWRRFRRRISSTSALCATLWR